MALLFPKIRRARQFDYKPRYFDPEKDARKERRKELCGSDVEQIDGKPYVPGQFIRKDMLARRGYGIKKKKKNNSIRRRVMIGICIGLILVVVVKYFL